MNLDGRPIWDEIWMGFAQSIARRSYDPRHQVGAVVVTEKNTQVLDNFSWSGDKNHRKSLDFLTEIIDFH